MIFTCCLAVVEFIWPAISAGLLSYLQNSTEEALGWMTNMIPAAVRFWSADRALPQASSSHSIVGEDNLSEIRRSLKNPEFKFIGIYGMGGIGKTTLLKEINNELFQSRSREFDVVIFVTVSNDVDIEKVKGEIGERLGLSGDQFPRNPEQRKRLLCESLARKKFLLLLDDLWRPLDLAEVGIPVSLISEKGSKIVFTTRSSDVCNKMDATRSKVKVRVLNEEKSWELFCEKLGRGDDEWNESTRSEAKKVVKKCGGLPLALITVGRAMADATDDGEWTRAVTILPDDVTTDVLHVLKFSFDRLRDRRLKECLLYCALYPEDYNIGVEEVVQRWIGEDFLDREELRLSIDEARNFGLTIITALKASCLLEDGREIGFQVKLHNLVRQMALWMTSPSFEEETNYFLVANGRKIVRAPSPEIWSGATRIALMSTQCKELPETLECQILRTLLLGGSSLFLTIPVGFFRSMRCLTVLDLAHSRITCLPPEIRCLVQLRYLNLSNTPVKSLPNEVGKLTKLRILDLNDTYDLRNISKEAISSLTCLQSLSMMPSNYEWIRGQMDYDAGSTGNEARLEDLYGLRRLNEVRVRIGIEGDEHLLQFPGFRRLLSAIRGLEVRLQIFSSFDMTGVLGAARGLKKLEINGGDALLELRLPRDRQTELEELSIQNFPRAIFSWNDCETSMREPPEGIPFGNLKVLRLISCTAVLEITWSGELPCLEELNLSFCSEMKEIARPGTDRERSSFFPRLRMIALLFMGKLESICIRPLSFPSLQEVFVLGCPNLKKLPFDSNSADNIKEIKGAPRWRNGLEWESDDVRSKFTPYFKDL